MKTNPEFDTFTDFMDKLAKVPNSEVKAALEAEKAAKEQQRLAEHQERWNRVAQKLKDDPTFQVPY